MRARVQLPLLLAVLAACNAAVDEASFVRLAEGFTSTDDRTGIVAAQRMFSVPSFAELCAPLEPPARLSAVTAEPLRLVRGEWFSYDRLVVVAGDAAGRVLPPVPVALEVEEIAPEVLNLRSDMTGDPDGKVLPVRAGAFRFRLSAICEGHDAVVTVTAEVVEP